MDYDIEGEEWKPEVKRILKYLNKVFSFNKENETFKEVVTPEEKSAAFDIKNRRIAYNLLGNGSRVSTVFLGMDHNLFGEAYTPILFETMAWYKDEEYECRRYATAEQAITGHNEVLAALEIAVANNI